MMQDNVLVQDSPPSSLTDAGQRTCTGQSSIIVGGRSIGQSNVPLETTPPCLFVDFSPFYLALFLVDVSVVRSILLVPSSPQLQFHAWTFNDPRYIESLHYLQELVEASDTPGTTPPPPPPPPPLS